MDDFNKDVKQLELNEVHRVLKRLYGESTSVTIHVTHDGMEITSSDRIGLKNYSMRRINGDWVSREPETHG
jgi:hypothetical protein